MHTESPYHNDIGLALLGLEPGQLTIDSETLFARTIFAFEATHEPMEAVDLLIAAISCLSAQTLDPSQNDKFKHMASTLTAIWTKKHSPIS